MSAAKIRLSQKEQELITNADFILTKNAILEKVKHQLLSLQEMQETYFNHRQLFLNNDGLHHSPKISKGENYKGLPYLMLDYPRVFNNHNIFAIRTMFWWGHFFSTTLHISGIYKNELAERIVTAFPLLAEKGFYYCVNGEQWQHDFDEANYLPLNMLNKDFLEKDFTKKSFIKIAIKIPLTPWDDVPELLFHHFREIMAILAVNFQDGEKVLLPDNPTTGFDL